MIVARNVYCVKVSHELQQDVETMQQLMRESNETEDMINSISLDAM